MADFSYWDWFIKATNDFNPVDDTIGGALGGADQFYADLGRLAKEAQEGKLTVEAAQAAAPKLEAFANSVNKMNAFLATQTPGGPNDSKLANVFRSVPAKINISVQNFTYALEEAARGNPSYLPQISAHVAEFFKTAGILFGLWGAAQEIAQKGYTDEGFDGAGSKALGVLTGYVGGTIGSMVLTGAAVFLGASLVMTVGAAVAGAIVIGYYSGKVGENLWEPIAWWYRDQVLPTLFDAGTQVYDAVSTGVQDKFASWGHFDGTWLEDLDATLKKLPPPMPF